MSLIEEDINDVSYGDDDGPDETGPTEAKLPFEELATHQNIAAHLTEEQRGKIADVVVDEYEIDKRSRSDWEKTTLEAIKLAKMETDPKTFPWKDAANVIYPTIALAAIQFSSRMLPLFVQGRNVAHAKVQGEDPQGLKAQQAELVERQLSDYMLDEIPDWLEETDALLANVSVVGTSFKKTWWNPVAQVVESRYVAAEDLVIHMGSPTTKRAPRITHLLRLYPNEVEERVRAGDWIEAPKEEDGDVGPALTESDASDEAVTRVDDGTEEAEDSEAPEIYAEQHRWWDLDGDGYKEPYICTVHLGLRKLVRMVARFGKVTLNREGQVTRIEPQEAFTKFPFLQAIDNAFYDVGYGQLLCHSSQVTNTIINQLLDSGTLQNAGGGIVKKGVKIGGKAGGEVRIRPAQWSEAQSLSDDIRKDLMPWPHSNPSPVLMELLKFMTESMSQIAMTTDALMGEIPPAGTPASSLLATIEQGQKVLSGIARRIWEAFSDEIDKIARLLAEQGVQMFVDMDQDGQIDLVPVADPNEVTDFQRINRAKAAFEIPGINQLEASRRMAEALGVADVDKLIPEEMPPSPEQIEAENKQKELEIKGQELEVKKGDQSLKAQEMQQNRLLALEEKKADIALTEAQAAKTLAETKAIDSDLDGALALVEELEGTVTDQRKELNERFGAPSPNGGGVAGVAGPPGDEGSDLPPSGGDGGTGGSPGGGRDDGLDGGGVPAPNGRPRSYPEGTTAGPGVAPAPATASE